MRIAIDSEPRLLSILRGVVRFCAREAGFSSAEAECLAMAIDEAAANIIRHTYAGRPDALLALEVTHFADRLEFILEDWGPKVCEELIHPRSLEDVPAGRPRHVFYQQFHGRMHLRSGFQRR